MLRDVGKRYCLRPFFVAGDATGGWRKTCKISYMYRLLDIHNAKI